MTIQLGRQEMLNIMNASLTLYLTKIVGDSASPTCCELEKHQIASEQLLLSNCVAAHKLTVPCLKSASQEYAISDIAQPWLKTQFQPYSAMKRVWECSETPNCSFCQGLRLFFSGHVALSHHWYFLPLSVPPAFLPTIALSIRYVLLGITTG